MGTTYFDARCLIVDDRLAKYRRKIGYIVEKLGELPPNLDDNFYFEALLYRLHTSIDAAMDIIAMLNRDLGLNVSDDYTNIDNLMNKGILDRYLAEKLKLLNGLRNVIVHKYNKLDEKIVRENLDEITEIMFSFIKVVENVLQKIFG